MPQHKLLGVLSYLPDGKAAGTIFLLGEGECGDQFRKRWPLCWLAGNPGIQALVIAPNSDQYHGRALIFVVRAVNTQIARACLAFWVGEECAGHAKLHRQRVQSCGVIRNDEQRLHIVRCQIATSRTQPRKPCEAFWALRAMEQRDQHRAALPECPEADDRSVSIRERKARNKLSRLNQERLPGCFRYGHSGFPLVANGDLRRLYALTSCAPRTPSSRSWRRRRSTRGRW